MPLAIGLAVGLVGLAKEPMERLLSIKKLFPERLVGVDAKPFGKVGSLVGWGVILALTVLGVLDLVEDLSRLS